MMPDREKVISRIEEEIHLGEHWDELYRMVDLQLLLDALALLKEQEAKIEQLNRFVNGFSRDAMPVVRCKDCKYWDADEHDCNIKMGWFACGADWFCADGERKEGREVNDR